VLTQILDPILHMSPLAVYLIVFALVFSEAAIFVGFIFPGETAVILGGSSPARAASSSPSSSRS